MLLTRLVLRPRWAKGGGGWGGNLLRRWLFREIFFRVRSSAGAFLRWSNALAWVGKGVHLAMECERKAEERTPQGGAGRG